MDRMHFGEHSSTQFNEALESIRNHLMEMGGLVEKQVVDALQALLQADSALAEKVIETEDRVDNLEILIDEQCTKVLALRQPAASDLRLIIAVSKAVSDLERIGDESAKIARMGLQLAEEGESGGDGLKWARMGLSPVGVVAQLLNYAEEEQLEQLFVDSNILAQQKFDGMRMIIHVRENDVIATNREGSDVDVVSLCLLYTSNEPTSRYAISYAVFC